MPNGDPKNWFRLLAVLDGFRGTFGHWPTRLHVYRPFIENFREHVFDEGAFKRFTDLIELVPDADGFRAEDDLGNVFRLGEDPFNEAPDDRAEDWLEIGPRYLLE